MLQHNFENELHRAVKMALDTGEAATRAAAYALFEGYRLAIGVGPTVAHSATLQAAVLTAVNTARRCFLGGVVVAGPLDVILRVPWRNCRTLREAVSDLGGSTTDEEVGDDPLIVIGDFDTPRRARPFAVRATFNGWAGGVTPLASDRRLPELHEFVPAGVLAGALAVSEAFLHVRGGNATVGRRDVGLSLWRPEPEVSWWSEQAVGPTLRLLPTKLWLIGLGHLGQAFLWTLGLLPYADPSALELVLQDFDTLVAANDSTSPLTSVPLLGRKKARAMAEWAESRGFRASIMERRFAPDFKIAAGDPSIALCGVDNSEARAALEDVGFLKIVEAGLGTGASEHLAFQVHAFPGPQSARELWGGKRVAFAAPKRAKIDQPAYTALAADGMDACGLALLAGRSVGASFVGTSVSTLVIAEVLRTLVGGPQYDLVDGSLRSLSHRVAITGINAKNAFSNPGYCFAATH